MPQIYVSIGTNVEHNKHLTMAMEQLYQNFGQLLISPVYQSAAVGFDGNDFYNLVAGFYSDLDVLALTQRFKDIERLSGRDHSAPKFSDRTLDIDLLNYGDEVINEPVVLPRDEILYHAFVLFPLADIASDWQHPVAAAPISEIASKFDASAQRLSQIADPINMDAYR
ncbi:2-amino-4-hydroxy-6-hydroxymethyldihydropteridine diphosphokinase [Pleionea litopenaei]|uniref:2-amino-4-hydroxy-6-hydroxymethyldihydropteridine diphosphokinase n=1 Tax=Pleionea litopenaei TaxID=3070815 RepID=A0AA51RQ57_9GAMM|nr:2-amino-4-hydroxy-6-hydroxymethyldihydropteridine diphosphokinase [Pleionea sp. HL-JVS1]WMS85578.1 2-amino-4-hydroxy-6-hydroxymethyldihydropteridine diphosphokinase [Pleionea sp. HL-JVS1]